MRPLEDQLDIKAVTKRLLGVPFPLTELPEPTATTYIELERRAGPLVDELWTNRTLWGQDVAALPPIWAVSLRTTAMFLNLSEAFRECDRDFVEHATKNEAAFVERYADCQGQTRCERASRMLARVVQMLRMLGFTSAIIEIGADRMYSGRCEETDRLFATWLM